MKLLRTLILCLCLPAAGCSLLPEIQHQPTLHNPFPQLTKIAIPPFFNLSHEATLDGRKVANAYFNELQLVPGFEVVPVGVTERAMQDYGIDLRGANDARRLAQILKVDAVVIGAVTDYTPYYPPRLALQVEWYAANPGFHPIPAGYGLPWGTRGERDIPSPLVFEAELALAKAQLKTQTPPCESMAIEPLPAKTGSSDKATHAEHGPNGGKPDGQAASYESAAGAKFAGGPVRGAEEGPASWPDARGFVPLPPSGRPPACVPSDAPVLRHTRAYNGHDTNFTEALASYYAFRDDGRMGGWQAYLQRSDDFIRFCCHMHIWEMLSARGGAGETRVVWRWPVVR